ncbi:LPS export ABC transporter permease LptG [Kordiimonas lacus]|uniref:Lipopolysaccharide export system permease protein n=1 Tax=Kordiimonas lacus TaxID=637679 RepID=A0A1G6VJH4_9PROT|nr:LPS export ABC transporter permease LptG [Kordiimonas lacus]SDD53671.1 lipopolysaccharide export system permease protein [Kordiimonas lacus]
MFTSRTLRRLFVPSRTLARYMVKMHLGRFFGILIGLTAVLQMLDLLATADDIMAAEGANWVSLASYISMRAPQLISQFVPFTALLATLLTLATLNQHSEVVVMKASGLSAHRILLPLGIASFIIAASHFLFNETVVVNANADLEYWQDNDYAVDLPPSAGPTGRVWIKENKTIVLVEAVSQIRNKVVLDKVSLFERDERGKLQAMVHADFAWYQDGRWTLHEVRRFDAGTHEMTIQPSQPWELETRPERFQALTVKPDHVSFPKLWQSMQELKKDGLPTDRLMASFLQKVAGPASSLLMPLLAAVAAFGVHRAGNLVLRVVFGMALGFSFFVADNFMLAMGEFGVAPPFLAAWAPFFLFLVVGYAVIFNSEEGSLPKKRKVLQEKPIAGE